MFLLCPFWKKSIKYSLRFFFSYKQNIGLSITDFLWNLCRMYIKYFGAFSNPSCHSFTCEIIVLLYI